MRETRCVVRVSGLWHRNPDFASPQKLQHADTAIDRASGTLKKMIRRYVLVFHTTHYDNGLIAGYDRPAGCTSSVWSRGPSYSCLFY